MQNRKNILRKFTVESKKKYLPHNYSNSKNFYLNGRKKRKRHNIITLGYPLFNMGLPLQSPEILKVYTKGLKQLSSNKQEHGSGNIRQKKNSKHIEIMQEKYKEINSVNSEVFKKYSLSKRPELSNKQLVYLDDYNSSTKNENRGKNTVWYVAIAPVHLRGLETIGRVFGKSKNTVKDWCNCGAPIAYDGSSYCAEYITLFTWYLDYYRVKSLE